MSTITPIGEAKGFEPLIVSDFDGVLNKYNEESGPVRKIVRTMHGAKYWINYDPIIVEEMNKTISETNSELGWLTTWGPNIKTVIEQAFEGKLAGGYVLAKTPKRVRGAIPANWKYIALQERIKQTKQKWVWMDDEAIEMSFLKAELTGTLHLIDGVEGLLLPTNPTEGISLQQIQIIKDYLS